jgi:hypothetical protein
VPADVQKFAEAVPNGATLVDLVELSPFKPFDTIKVVYRLAELGLLSRRDPVRSISPLTAQLAVRDWLLGTAEPQPRSTVTEAGRRAAEAYAEAASRRAQAEALPSDDLFERAPTPAVPTPVPDDVPTAPREAAKGASARNKPKKPKAPTDPEKYADAPSDTAQTARLPREVLKEAPAKEPVFDDVDEAFFAREADIGHVEPVDNFDDLEHTGAKRKLNPKRKWSLFGDKPTPAGPTGRGAKKR